MQNIYNFIVGKWSLQEWQTSMISLEISDSNPRRLGDTVQNLESPGLSGRVDSSCKSVIFDSQH